MSNLVPNSVYAELCAEHGAELAAELAAELRAWQFSTIPLPVPFNTMREIAFAIVFVSCTRPVVVIFCLKSKLSPITCYVTLQRGASDDKARGIIHRKQGII